MLRAWRIPIGVRPLDQSRLWIYDPGKEQRTSGRELETPSVHRFLMIWNQNLRDKRGSFA
jgi:hypothetical protein